MEDTLKGGQRHTSLDPGAKQEDESNYAGGRSKPLVLSHMQRLTRGGRTRTSLDFSKTTVKDHAV